MVEDDEIDLRPYLMTLMRRWKLIAGITVLFAAVAAGISFATPTTYEATSTVAIAAPGAQPTPAAKAYMDLATGDKVLSALAKDLAANGGPATSPADLKGALKAVQGSDPGQVNLQARDTNPEHASQIAAAWATSFAAVANATFNNTKDNLDQLEKQSKVALAQLSQAEDGLAAQESRNSVAVLQTQITAQQKTLTDLYRSKSSMQEVGTLANGLMARLRRLDPNRLSGPADDLSILQLEMRILGAPVQIQLPATSSSGRTVGAQISHLDGLTTMISDRLAAADRQIVDAQTALMDLQDKMQIATDEQVPLVAARDNARQIIKELSLKSAQGRIAAEAGANRSHLVGNPATPVAALAKGTTRNVAVAGMLGLMAGTVIAFGAAYLQSRQKAIVQEPRNGSGHQGSSAH